MKKHILTVLISLAGVFSPVRVYAQDVSADLKLLDSSLEMADEYYRNKETLISSLESLLSYPNTSADQQFTIYGQIYKETYSYSFDRALSALNSQQALASGLGERYVQQVFLDKTLLLTTAGLYMEAKDIIDNKIDTLRLSSAQRIEYYYAMQRFWKDYSEYSDLKAISGESPSSRVTYFRRRYIEQTDEADFRHRQLSVLNLIDEGRHSEAESQNLSLLSDLDSLSHEYAIMSYYQALIRYYQGDTEGRLHWLVKSAVIDIKNAVKDYASLSSIASDLLSTDVERSSRYIQISIEDALFYNAKLRPLQIARLLPGIDHAYRIKQEEMQRKAFNALRATIIISLILLGLLLALACLLRKLSLERKSLLLEVDSLACRADVLEQRTLEMKSAFERLCVNDSAKKEQVVALFGTISTYLSRLRKHMSPEQKEVELKQYYSAFDNAFLQMYPSFVEDFNSLLRPDCRLELKKDDILNTELRIFALIKLGVTQSSSIATLLRYSVNTIYNYRAQIKNSSLDRREDFEKNVMRIGEVEI